MKEGKVKKELSFQKAVEETKDIANCYQAGLKALGKYSTKIVLKDSQKCCGSVDLDGCVTLKYPQDNRWDYVICYDGEVYFAEVHSANTGEVSTVLRKLKWLKDWLNTKAPEINKLKATSQTPFYWIQSNGNHILPQSRQARQAAIFGLKPVAVLHLP